MANYCYPSILPEVHRSCHNNMFTGLIHDFKINIKHAIKPLTNVMLKGICKQLWKLQKNPSRAIVENDVSVSENKKIKIVAVSPDESCLGF